MMKYRRIDQIFMMNISVLLENLKIHAKFKIGKAIKQSGISNY